MEDEYQRVVEGLGGLEAAKAKAVHAELALLYPQITYQVGLMGCTFMQG